MSERQRQNWVNPHEKGQYRQSVEKRQIHQQQLNMNLSIHWEQSRSSLRSKVQHQVPLPCDTWFQGRGWSGKPKPIQASGNPDCIIITYLYLCYFHLKTTLLLPHLLNNQEVFFDKCCPQHTLVLFLCCTVQLCHMLLFLMLYK